MTSQKKESSENKSTEASQSSSLPDLNNVNMVLPSMATIRDHDCSNNQDCMEFFSLPSSLSTMSSPNKDPSSVLKILDEVLAILDTQDDMESIEYMMNGRF